MKFSLRTMVSILILGLFIGCQYVPGSNLLSFGPSDMNISEAVHVALENDPELAPFTFHIETSERVVYLSGYVKTIRQSDDAERLASQVRGVKKVENNIIVRK